ncbi:MAG: hypothetical protein HYT64_00480 [Candidatus Yanofskybacteria bacterium]|nr:hypothetical protein [Candidatus Yanofskybacteria bacterium]
MSEKEVKAVVKFLKDQGYEAEAEEGEETLEESLAQSIESGPGASIPMENDFGQADDSLFGEAKEVVLQAKKASASLLQRRLRIGYARAARLLDMLEERKVVGPAEGAKPREVLIKSETSQTIEPSANIAEKEENGNTLV